MVPKNNAGLSTHTDPGSPSTLKKSPTNLARSPVNGEVVAPHHQGGGYQVGTQVPPPPSQSARHHTVLSLCQSAIHLLILCPSAKLCLASFVQFFTGLSGSPKLPPKYPISVQYVIRDIVECIPHNINKTKLRLHVP